MNRAVKLNRAPERGDARPSTTNSATTPFRGSTSRTLSILAALGSRYGILYWGPLLVWVVAAALTRALAQYWDAGLIPFETSAYFWLTQVRMVAVFLMWAYGSQFAVALGYRRGPVFLVTAAVSAAMFIGTQLLAEVANRIELGLGGVYGERLLALDTSMSPDVIPSPLFESLVSATVTNVALPFTTTMGPVLIVLFALGRKRHRVPAMAAALAVVLVANVVVVLAVSAPWPNVILQSVAVGLSWAASLALVWVAFRRVSV